MERHSLTLVDGTSALSSSALLDAEFAKDRWDARNIPGLRYAPHTDKFYSTFTGIPDMFCPVVKDYVKFLLATGRSAQTLRVNAIHLRTFLTFYLQRYSEARTLHDLTMQDIDAFILSLKMTVSKRGLKNENSYIWEHVYHVEGFLCYLERIQSPVKPKEPPTRIIWPHHYPHEAFVKAPQVKYIPQVVLAQFDTHLPHLPPRYIPAVIILRASGWRISDVLYLKRDTCLERKGDQFWLVGDIQKTRVLGHKIPITTEVAAVIMTQVAWVKAHYTDEENPQGWLFPALKRRSKSQRALKGLPLKADSIGVALNQLAARYQIWDEQGKLFHFRLHAFRHTKAVELINGGMSLVMVQQWMAHASPEMTLIYAKILDETMRVQWEKTVQHGIVQFHEGKPEYVSGKKMLTVLGSENAFNPHRVRAHRANLKMPVGTCTKTPKLTCKFTELPCFYCPAYVLTPEDLPTLEAYEQQLIERIEIGKQAGNAYWIEINQNNLDERVRPTIALLKAGQTVAKSDKYEREYTPEEWEQRQAQQHIREEGDS
jgi:integrase